jgi:cytochrome bd-type quinol oxidase subunit 2
VVVHLTQAHVLLGSAAAFLLGGYTFASGWFDWASLFRSHPLLSIPCTLSLFVAPAMCYISVRQMTEIGVRMRLVLSALLSVVAVGLIALGLHLWLQNAAA